MDERVVIVTINGGVKFSTYTNKLRGKTYFNEPKFKDSGDKMFSEKGIECWFRLLKTE